MVQLMSVHGRPNFVDYYDQHPVTQFLSKFVSENSLPPSIRQLTCAETIYIVERSLGRFFAWPVRFGEVRKFLNSIHFYVGRIRMTPKVQYLWSSGFLFFGCRRFVDTAIKQLKLERTMTEQLVVAACNQFMRSSIVSRKANDLVYYVNNNIGTRCLSLLDTEKDMKRPLLCVDSSRVLCLSDFFSGN